MHAVGTGELHMHAGKRLISLYPADKTRLDAKLGGGGLQQMPTMKEPTGGDTCAH